MTLNEAFDELINSPGFIAQAKVRDSIGGKYRSYLSRYNNGKLKAGAMVEILIKNGYEIKANKVRKAKK